MEKMETLTKDEVILGHIYDAIDALMEVRDDLCLGKKWMADADLNIALQHLQEAERNITIFGDLTVSGK